MNVALVQAFTAYGPRELSQLQKILQNPDFGELMVVPEFLLSYPKRTEFSTKWKAARGKFILIYLTLRASWVVQACVSSALSYHVEKLLGAVPCHLMTIQC